MSHSVKSSREDHRAGEKVPARKDLVEEKEDESNGRSMGLSDGLLNARLARG